MLSSQDVPLILSSVYDTGILKILESKVIDLLVVFLSLAANGSPGYLDIWERILYKES